MAICSVCGTSVKDDEQYCPMCFSPMNAKPQPTAQDQVQPEVNAWGSAVVQQNPAPKTNRKKVLFLAIGIPAGLVLFIFIGFLIYEGVQLHDMKRQFENQLAFQAANPATQEDETTSQQADSQTVTEDSAQQTDSQDAGTQEDSDEQAYDFVAVDKTMDFRSYGFGVTPAGTVDVTAREGIDPNQVTSYPDALNPDLYLDFKETEYGSKFMGSVPGSLFKVAYENTGRLTGTYGDSVFTRYYGGSDGTYLAYEYIERNDSLSSKDFMESIKSSEERRMPNRFKPMQDKINGDVGTLVIAGETVDAPVYEIFHIEPGFIMKMEMSYPKETDEVDQQRKWYVVECLYRMCFFSGSTQGYRSFENYCLGVQ